MSVLFVIMDESESDDEMEFGEDAEYIESRILANHYAPLFPRNIRTEKFLDVFKDCFGPDSTFCSLSQPLLCESCLDKYINNSLIIIEDNNNAEQVEILKTLIVPRLEELKDQLDLIVQEGMTSDEPLNIDNVYDFLNIDMSIYDPPSDSVLNKCTVITYNKNDDNVYNICSICLCDFEEGDQVRKLICGHLYHENCVMKWLEKNSTCPICKTSLKEK